MAFPCWSTYRDGGFGSRVAHCGVRELDCRGVSCAAGAFCAAETAAPQSKSVLAAEMAGPQSMALLEAEMAAPRSKSVLAAETAAPQSKSVLAVEMGAPQARAVGRVGMLVTETDSA